MSKHRNRESHSGESDAEIYYLLDSAFGKKLMVLYTELNELVPPLNYEQRRQVAVAMIQAMLIEEGRMWNAEVIAKMKRSRCK